MGNNFESAFWDWLYKCPCFEDLFLVLADLENVELDGQIVISPEVIGTDDIYIKKYYRGAGKKRYTLNVAQYDKLENNTNSKSNVEILDAAKKIQQWIVEQIKLKNYPLIKYDILNFETTGISIAGVDEDGGIKIQFQLLMDYYYKEEN